MMDEPQVKLKKLNRDLTIVKNNFLDYLERENAYTHIYTHIDADGLSSGAILGKTLLRKNIPFQITTLRQLEKEEIVKISIDVREHEHFLIFSDFGSGQYFELEKILIEEKDFNSFLILDHHLPQKISDKNDLDLINDAYNKTKDWHINPYFYGTDGSLEVSGAGICYFFSKCIDERNIDLSPVAIVGATGDIQNQGPNKSFQGLNTLILEDSKSIGLIEVKDDLNFSSIKPLNEAIAYSNDINLPGLTKNANKTLIFLQTLGILIENSEGNIKSLSELNQEEKQKISSAIIEYGSVKLNVDPRSIIEKLIINRYLLKNELNHSELHDASEFSNLLNACGRNNYASLGIAIAMGDRKKSYQKSQEILKNYKKSLLTSLSWLQDNHKIQQKEYIQYFFGEDIIPESIIGTVSSMLIFNKFNEVDDSKPIFGLAKREDEDVYKVSGRAHEKIVNRGINLSKAIRDACDLSGLDVLGGGHPPAAGTKIPLDKAELFLESCNTVIQKQIKAEK
jgi:RecJ-like exonuclease